MAKNSGVDVVGMLEPLFDQLPKLPKNVRDTLVNIAPILALIFGILGVLGAVAGGVRSYGFGYIAAFILIVSSVLLLVAYPSLKARKMKGWNLLFWGEILNLVYGVISMSILSGIIGAVIGLYLLFQVKSYYSK